MIVNKYNYGGGGSSSAVTPEEVQQQIDSALTPYWESAETQSAITSVSGALQTQIDTIDDVVGAALVDLNDRVNTISAATPTVDLSGYYTSAQTESAITSAYTVLDTHITDVEQVTASAYTELHDGLMEVSARTVDLSPYWNSAQTESAITQAVSGKADAASVNANTDFTFPAWNEQGIITGVAGPTNPRAYRNNLILNGQSHYLWSNADWYYPTFYAPNSAGTAGDILMSSGSGAPVWVTPATINGSAITGGNIEIQAGVTSADVKTQIEAYNYVTSAQVETQITDKGYLTSADTQDFLTSADTANFMDSTDAQVISTALNDLNTNKVAGSGITNIIKIEQTAYDTLVAQSATTPTTLYVVVPDTQ